MLKAILQTEDFIKVTSSAAVGFSKNSTVDVQDYQQISIKDNSISAICCNSDNAIESRISLDNPFENEMTFLLHKTKVNKLNLLFDDTTEIEYFEDERIDGKNGEFEFSWKTIENNLFPTLPVTNGDELYSFVVTLPELKKKLSSVKRGISASEERPILTNVMCMHEDNRLILQSCDGYCMQVDAIETLSNGDINFNLPKEFLVFIEKLKGEENVTVKILKGFAICEYTEDNFSTKAIFRLYEGQGLNYNNLIRDAGFTIKVNKSDFIKKIEKVVGLTDLEENSYIVLEFADGNSNMLIKMRGANDKNVDTLSFDGESNLTFKIAFNYRYLKDILKAISSDFVSLGLTNSTSQIRVQSMVDDEIQSFPRMTVMPVRIGDESESI